MSADEARTYGLIDDVLAQRAALSPSAPPGADGTRT
jgi:ATP-dependent protease ClpP protease subunit